MAHSFISGFDSKKNKFEQVRAKKSEINGIFEPKPGRKVWNVFPLNFNH